MTLSIRLDPELESELARAAAQTGRSKSELVKASLREYLARLAPRKTPLRARQGPVRRSVRHGGNARSHQQGPRP
jgi:hypothetical protein